MSNTDLAYQRHLSRLARSGLFPHPERLTLRFERQQRRVLRAFSRASRAGPPPCPHCGQAITAEDWDRGQRGSMRATEAQSARSPE